MFFVLFGGGFYCVLWYMYRVSFILCWGRVMYVGEGVRKGELYRVRGRVY